jgi:hypothetical protein
MKGAFAFGNVFRGQQCLAQNVRKGLSHFPQKGFCHVHGIVNRQVTLLVDKILLDPQW